MMKETTMKLKNLRKNLRLKVEKGNSKWLIQFTRSTLASQGQLKKCVLLISYETVPQNKVQKKVKVNANEVSTMKGSINSLAVMIIFKTTGCDKKNGRSNI